MEGFGSGSAQISYESGSGYTIRIRNTAIFNHGMRNMCFRSWYTTEISEQLKRPVDSSNPTGKQETLNYNIKSRETVHLLYLGCCRCPPAGGTCPPPSAHSSCSGSATIWKEFHVRASDSQYRSRNSPGFHTSILRHSGIWGGGRWNSME